MDRAYISTAILTSISSILNIFVCFFFVGDFYEKKQQKIFNIDDIDVNKILVSKKEPYGTKNALKYFIGYNDNDVIRPLYLRLSQMTGYTTKFVKNNITTMSLRVKDTKLLKN